MLCTITGHYYQYCTSRMAMLCWSNNARTNRSTLVSLLIGASAPTHIILSQVLAGIGTNGQL